MSLKGCFLKPALLATAHCFNPLSLMILSILSATGKLKFAIFI
nr:MAG TPA: hypothetical protein [Caudoviricetes sp.]